MKSLSIMPFFFSFCTLLTLFFVFFCEGVACAFKCISAASQCTLAVARDEEEEGEEKMK